MLPHVNSLQSKLPSVEKLIRRCENPDNGDFCIQTFSLAKEKKLSPADLAVELAAQLQDPDYFESVSASGPYVNFKFSWSYIINHLMKIKPSEQDPCKDPVLIDFSSPNIAKPIAFHHIRSTVIGNSLARIYESMGEKVVRINYLGDWGTTQGKLIFAHSMYGSDSEMENDGIDYLLKIYVRFCEEEKQNPSLTQRASSISALLEQGYACPERGIWNQIRSVSMHEFSEMYSRLGIRFDDFGEHCESKYAFETDSVISYLHSKNAFIMKETDGCILVHLSNKKLPPIILKKADGGSIYATRDIAAILDRWNKYHFKKMVYIVGNTQKLYFQQLKTLFSDIGEAEIAARIEHIGFGTLLMKDPESGEVSKGSSRSGNVIKLSDVLDKTRDVVKERNSFNQDPLNLKIEEMIGVGSVIFNDLSIHRDRDVVFDWDEATKMTGETAAYIMYAIARINTICKKCGWVDWHRDVFEFEPESAPSNKEERDLVFEISKMNGVLEESYKNNDPSKVATFALGVAKKFSLLYNVPGYRFVTDRTDHNLTVALKTKDVLVKALDLLGIVRIPSEM